MEGDDLQPQERPENYRSSLRKRAKEAKRIKCIVVDPKGSEMSLEFGINDFLIKNDVKEISTVSSILIGNSFKLIIFYK